MERVPVMNRTNLGAKPSGAGNRGSAAPFCLYPVEVIDHVVAFAKGQIASHCRLSLAWGCSATCDFESLEPWSVDLASLKHTVVL